MITFFPYERKKALRTYQFQDRSFSIQQLKILNQTMKERDKIHHGLNEVKFKFFEIIKVLPSEIIIILLH